MYIVCMCAYDIFNMMFVFATVCNLDCNNHGSANSDCLTCTCDPNWGGPTCGGMYLRIKKARKKEKIKGRKEKKCYI